MTNGAKFRAAYGFAREKATDNWLYVPIAVDAAMRVRHLSATAMTCRELDVTGGQVIIITQGVDGEFNTAVAMTSVDDGNGEMRISDLSTYDNGARVAAYRMLCGRLANGEV